MLLLLKYSQLSQQYRCHLLEYTLLRTKLQELIQRYTFEFKEILQKFSKKIVQITLKR